MGEKNVSLQEESERKYNEGDENGSDIRKKQWMTMYKTNKEGVRRVAVGERESDKINKE